MHFQVWIAALTVIVPVTLLAKTTSAAPVTSMTQIRNVASILIAPLAMSAMETAVSMVEANLFLDAVLTIWELSAAQTTTAHQNTPARRRLV
jgi:hypothetical protein